MNDEFRYMGVAKIARLLRRRAVSSLEVTRSTIALLQEWGPPMNAIAELTASLGEKQARLADRRLARGEERSPVLGIPYGAKDMIATAGIHTRCGTAAFRDQIFNYDATVIERLRDAGAPLVAKFAMVEFAGGGGYRYASASIHGPGLNPWNLRHWAGGSSSGSAAAVAAGLVPFALAAETMGSIMTPSSFCGVSGFRPSYGIVSRFGAMDLAWSMEKIGAMARSAEDCAKVISVMAGQDDRDPTSVDWTYKAPQRKSFRVGVLPADLSGAPATAAAFDAALASLRRAGMRLRKVTIPEHEYNKIGRAIIVGEASEAHEAFLSGPQLEMVIDDAQREGLRAYLQQPARAYAHAVRERAVAARDLRRVFRQVDVLIAPTMPDEAPTVDTDLRAHLRHSQYSSLGSVGGLPGLSVPMGFGPRGLPLGLSVIGDLYADATVLKVGMAFQRATDWHVRRPPEIAQAARREGKGGEAA